VLFSSLSQFSLTQSAALLTIAFISATEAREKQSALPGRW
jgi:hypothetical protein